MAEQPRKHAPRWVQRFCPDCVCWWRRRFHARSWCPVCHALLIDRELPKPRPARVELRPGIVGDWTDDDPQTPSRPTVAADRH